MFFRSANSNIELSKADESLLDNLIGDLPNEDLPQIKKLRIKMVNAVASHVMNEIRRYTKKYKTFPLVISAAYVFAVVEAAQSVVRAVTDYNPAGAEILKRHIKEKVASW